MIFDFSAILVASWGAEIDKIVRKPRDTWLVFASTIATLSSHVFSWNIEKKLFFPQVERPQRKKNR